MSMTNGYVKLWRGFANNETLERDPLTRLIFLRLILGAEWREGEELPVGAIRITRLELAHFAGCSEQQVQRRLERLKTDRMIDRIGSTRSSYIQVRNFSKWQAIDRISDRKPIESEKRLISLKKEENTSACARESSPPRNGASSRYHEAAARPSAEQLRAVRDVFANRKPLPRRDPEK